MGGGGQTINNEAPRVGALRIQTSAYGLPIALVWGQTRVQGNLLWFGDFTAIPHTDSQKSGGKAGGGSVTYNNTTYTYTAAVAIGLVEGPIDSIVSVWAGKNRKTLAELGFSTFTGVTQQAPWSYLTSLHPGQAIGYEGIAYVANGAYALAQDGSLPNHSFEIRAGLSVGLVTAAAKAFTVSPAPGAPKTVTSWNTPFNQLPTTFVSAAHGFVDNQPLIFTGVSAPPNVGIGVVYYLFASNANAFGLRQVAGGPAICFANGTGSGAFTLQPVVSVFNSAAHGFTGNQVVRASTTGTLPSRLNLGTDYYVLVLSANSFSLAPGPSGTPVFVASIGTGTHTATPFIVDANLKDVLNDFLTNTEYGVLFPSAKMGDLTQFSNYCVARGLFVSPALTAQAPANQFVTDLLDLANSAPVWSGNVLKILPYGDQAITGNGVTYTPDVTPIYDLGDDDFIASEGEDPVKQIRSATADAFNQLQVKFTNRANQYNDEIAEAKDQANIEQFGLRPDQQKPLPYINDATVARNVVQTMLQRKLYIRNQYEFTVGLRYSRLEPMDIVTLTDPGLFLTKAPVRITEVEDSDDGILLRAEEFPAGVGHAALYPSQLTTGFAVDYNVAPGSVTMPLIFDAPGILTVTGYELWIAVAGGAAWGGCQVWASVDNIEFKQVGQISGGARYGTLTSDFAAGSDPDTTSTLAVDLSLSNGSLVAGSQADADAFNTLCWIEGELVAYRDAVLTGTNQYNLSGYVRRGIYNSVEAAHAIGTRFARLDQAIFRNEYDPSLRGQTIYFKFPSFNSYGAALEDISTLTSYGVVIGGSISYPSTPTGFAAQQNGNACLFEWILIDGEPNIFGYEIRYNPLGDHTWGNGTFLTRATRGTSITSVKLPPGAWTVMLCSYDTSQRYSRAPATFDITINNLNTLLAMQQQAPNWPGVMSGMRMHWTGVLHPRSQSKANAAGWEIFDQFVYNPVTSGYYEAPEIDLLADGNVRIHGEITSQLGPGVDPLTNNSTPGFAIDSKLSAGVYSGIFQPWTIGSVNCRYFKSRIVLDAAKSNVLVRIAAFAPTADAEIRPESYKNIPIPNTGLVLVFAQPFHAPPSVQVTPVGVVAQFGGATGITNSQATIFVYNSSGVAVTGSANIDISGP